MLSVRRTTLGRIAGKVAEAGQREQAARILSEATETAKTIEGGGFDSYQSFTEVAIRHATNGDLDQALEAAKTIMEPWQEASALAKIATMLAETGQKEQAMGFLSHSLDEPMRALGGYEKSASLTDIASVYAKIGEKERVLQLLSQGFEEAKTIDKADEKSWALTNIAEQYAKIGEKDLASRLLMQALDAAKMIEDADDKFMGMDVIAIRHVENGDLLQALGIVMAMEDTTRWSWKTWAMSDIAAKVVQLGEEDKAKLQSITRTVRPIGGLWD